MVKVKIKIKEINDKYANNKYYLFFLQLYKQAIKHQVSNSGAMLAYYFILSFFPFLIFLISMLSYTPLVSIDLVEAVIKVFPAEVGLTIANFINDLVSSRSDAIVSTSIIVTLYSSSKGLSSLIEAINRAYNLKDDRNIVVKTILALIFTVFVAISIVIMLVSIVFGGVIITYIFNILNIERVAIDIYTVLRFILPAMFMFIVLVLLYKYAPNKKIKWKSTFKGAIFATIGIILSSMIFSFYVSNFGKYNVTYGSLGGVVVLLIWINLLGTIIVLGAEINGAILKVNKEVSNSIELK